MDKAALHEKLDAYLKGRLDAAEQAEVRQLIDSDKRVAEQLELVRLEQELAEVMVDEKLDEMMKAWNEESPSPSPISDTAPKPKASSFPGKWVMWGAVLIICAGLVFWPWLSPQETAASDVVNEDPPSSVQSEDTEPSVDAPTEAATSEPTAQETKKAPAPAKKESKTPPPIASTKEPQPSEAIQQLALAVAANTSPTDRLIIVRKGEQANESPLAKGYRLMGEGKLDEAEAALLTVPEAQARRYLNAQQYLAFIYFEKGEYEKAIPILENLTQINYSQQAEMEWYLALSYLATENSKGLDALKQVATQSTSPEIQEEAQQLLDEINALD
jgi:tetratricopeptide (TPR) repeat protein